MVKNFILPLLVPVCNGDVELLRVLDVYLFVNFSMVISVADQNVTHEKLVKLSKQVKHKKNTKFTRSMLWMEQILHIYEKSSRFAFFFSECNKPYIYQCSSTILILIQGSGQ